jgi:hypothetical protein
LLLFLDPGSGMDKNQGPGTGINIPEPKHCFKGLIFNLIAVRAFIQLSISHRVLKNREYPRGSFLIVGPLT